MQLNERDGVNIGVTLNWRFYLADIFVCYTGKIDNIVSQIFLTAEVQLRAESCMLASLRYFAQF